METSTEIKNLAAALSKAQAAIKCASMDSENPGFKRNGKNSKYADLASVWEACRTALTENGFSVSQGVSSVGKVVKVTTLLLHSSGEWIRDALEMTAMDEKPHSLGSAITYGRRYGLSAMVGVAPDDDDDGNTASGKIPSRAQERPGFANGIPMEQHEKEQAEKNSQHDLGTFSDYVVSGVKGKSGKRADGTKWQAYIITTQENGDVGTYDEKVFTLCGMAQDNGQKVTFESEPGKYGPVIKAAMIPEIPETVPA